MVVSQARSHPAPALSAVGECLRALRHDLGATLSDVAERTGVSISNLSKIERGDVSPSFDIVMRICQGLDISIEYFVKPGPKNSVNGRKTTTLKGQAIEVSSAQYDYFAHASELSRKAMVPLEMWVRARTVEEFGHWSQHTGEEFVFVIAGSIDVHTDQYAQFTLKAGESAYFDSGMKHVYVSVGDGDAHLLSISFNPEFTSRSEIESFMNPAVRMGAPKP